MKHILIICLLALWGTNKSFAQILGPGGGGTIPDPGTPICGIYFDYDAAGNRIKRYYDCKTIEPGPEEPIEISTFYPDISGSDGYARIFPNPALSYVSISFSRPVEHVHFHLYDAKGSILQSGSITGSSYRIELSGYADGIYLIALKDGDKQYRFKIVLKH
jgi:hypothetical protein